MVAGTSSGITAQTWQTAVLICFFFFFMLCCGLCLYTRMRSRRRHGHYGHDDDEQQSLLESAEAPSAAYGHNGRGRSSDVAAIGTPAACSSPVRRSDHSAKVVSICRTATTLATPITRITANTQRNPLNVSCPIESADDRAFSRNAEMAEDMTRDRSPDRANISRLDQRWNVSDGPNASNRPTWFLPWLYPAEITSAGLNLPCLG